MKKYVAISGNMGVGKSTLVDFLCTTYNIKPFFEPNDLNPYLADFYNDMKKWAFKSQIHFLSNKFRIHQELGCVKQPVIQDRTIYEDAEIFATNLYKKKIMEKRDFQTYYDLYQTILKSLKPPDLMIYLECSVRTVMKRIRKRGRKMEQQVPTSYVQNLNRLYEQWIGGYRLSPVIKISTEKLDYISDFIDRDDLLKKVERYLDV
ncbi:MAG: deoxynucleoside kinase [Deltaproteobacteria bacterium]|nr:deoxynucleoside kinase [Deltaproteobacteria bacterium]